MIYDTANIVDSTDANIYLKKLIKKGAKVEVKEIKKKRSLSLNAYMHVVITLYAIHFGYTIEEAKTLLKRMCNFMIYEKNGNKFLKRTRDLDNEVCSNFVEWIRNEAAKHGCYIPDADNYTKNRFAIDKEISKNREFL